MYSLIIRCWAGSGWIQEGNLRGHGSPGLHLICAKLFADDLKVHFKISVRSFSNPTLIKFMQGRWLGNCQFHYEIGNCLVSYSKCNILEFGGIHLAMLLFLFSVIKQAQIIRYSIRKLSFCCKFAWSCCTSWCTERAVIHSSYNYYWYQNRTAKLGWSCILISSSVYTTWPKHLYPNYANSLIWQDVSLCLIMRWFDGLLTFSMLRLMFRVHVHVHVVLVKTIWNSVYESRLTSSGRCLKSTMHL